MNEEKRNKYDLFDAPLKSPMKKRITLTSEMLQQQLDAGAFFMTHEEAVKAGLLSPYGNDDAVTTYIATGE